MPSVKFRVVVARFDSEREDDLADGLCEELDIDMAEAKAMLEKLPLTVARRLSEDDAEDLADFLEDLGARVRLVEESPARRRRRRPPPPVDEEEDENPVDDEDEYDDDDDDDYDPRPRPKRGRREAPASQRVALIGGLVVLVVLIGMLIFGVVSDGISLGGCGGNYRGAGADSSLVGTLPQLATRYARGFRADEAPAHGSLAANETVTLSEELTGPACYVWIGRSPDRTDLDLFLKQGGRVLQQDRDDDNFPVVRQCVPNDLTLDLEVQMYGGAGEWVVQRYVLGGEPGADTLQMMHKLYSSMFIAGGEPVGELQRVKQMSPGQAHEIPLELDSQWCYVVLAVSQPGTDLDMVIENPQGREVGRDEAVDHYPLVRDICPTKSGQYRMKLLMYSGSSGAAYQLYRGKLGGSVPASSAPGESGGSGDGRAHPSSKAPVPPLNLGDRPASSGDAAAGSDNAEATNAAPDASAQ